MRPTARLDRPSSSTTRTGLSMLRGTGEFWVYLDLDSAWEAISTLGQDADDYANDAGALNEELAEWMKQTLNNNGFNASIEERNADNKFNSLYTIAVVDGEIAQSDIESLADEAKSFMDDNASAIVYARLSSDTSNVEGVKNLIDNIKVKSSPPDTEGVRLAPYVTRMREIPTVHFKSVSGTGDGGANGSDGDGETTPQVNTFTVTGVANGRLVAAPQGDVPQEFRQQGGTVRITVLPEDIHIDPIDDPIDDPSDPGDPTPVLQGLGQRAASKPTMRLPSRQNRRGSASSRPRGLGQTQVQSFTLTVPGGSYRTRPDGKVEVAIQEPIPQAIRDGVQSGHLVTMAVQSIGSDGGNGNGGNGNGGNGNGGNGSGSNGGGGTVVDGRTQPTGQQAGMVPGVSNATLVLGVAGVASLAIVAASN